MPRPKSEKPALPYSVRLNAEMRAKFEVVAAKERRKPTELVRLLIEDSIAAYEKEHGAIVLPSDSSQRGGEPS